MKARIYTSKVLAICIILALLSITTSAAAEKMSLTSLEWPPYTSDAMDAKGASAKVVADALAEVGMELDIQFYPWQRAVNMAKSDAAFIGYFPEYHSTAIEEEFIFSEPIGSSPLGFIERKDESIAWKTLNDLKAYTIGVVSGYVNTTDFDAMMASGDIKTEAVSDDATNIKKVAGGRIHMAVIDKNVFNYLLKTDPALAGMGDKLQFNANVLEDKKLYVCVRKSPEGEAAIAKLNEGIAKIDPEAIQGAYISKALGN